MLLIGMYVVQRVIKVWNVLVGYMCASEGIPRGLAAAPHCGGLPVGGVSPVYDSWSIHATGKLRMEGPVDWRGWNGCRLESRVIGMQTGPLLSVHTPSTAVRTSCLVMVLG